MSAPDMPAPTRLDEPMLLWNKVVHARSVVATQRHSAAASSSSSMARAELLSALEAYASSLTNHGRPIPYVLRDELRLKRRTG